MARIAFIGAGSTVFTRNLVGDVLRRPELADTTTFALMDIDAERLETSEAAVRAMARAAGSRADVEATLDRRTALDGADYVVTSFQVGGYRPATVVDFEVPKRFGLRQTIGDTVGVGGIMRGLRTIPVLLGVCRDMEELLPRRAPAAVRQPDGDAVLGGGAGQQRPRRGPVPLRPAHRRRARRRPRARARRPRPPRRRDQPPRLLPAPRARRRGSLSGLREVTPPAANRVRYEVLRHLGYFVTESSEHFAEYVPWFIKAARPDLVERFNIPLDEYPRRCEAQIAEWDALRSRLREGDRAAVQTAPSVEYGADIIRACETGEPFAFNGNVPNALDGRPPHRRAARGLLRRGAVRGLRARIEPQRVGALPRQLAALMQTNVNVQGLTVDAALTGRPRRRPPRGDARPAHRRRARARQDRPSWSTR